MKVKKLLTIAFATLLLLGMSIGVFSSTPETDPCSEGGYCTTVYEETIITSSGCITFGQYVIYCTKCNTEYDSGEFVDENHNWVGNPGYEHCSVCGIYFNIPK